MLAVFNSRKETQVMGGYANLQPPTSEPTQVLGEPTVFTK